MVEDGGLNVETQISLKLESAQRATAEFLSYQFFKVDASWRGLDRKARSKGKREFESLINKSAQDLILKSYSLIGLRSDADFMFWLIGRKIEHFQEFTSQILQSQLGRCLQIPYSYLAVTRRSEYTGGHRHAQQEGASSMRRPSDSRYFFLYPFTKKREWYFLSFEDRRRMMQQHFQIGHKYPNIKINTGYSFGLGDHEFVLAFEGDEPADFCELVRELRESEASKYTAVETPVFTCISMPIGEILNLL